MPPKIETKPKVKPKLTVAEKLLTAVEVAVENWGTSSNRAIWDVIIACHKAKNKVDAVSVYYTLCEGVKKHLPELGDASKKVYVSKIQTIFLKSTNEDIERWKNEKISWHTAYEEKSAKHSKPKESKSWSRAEADGEVTETATIDDEGEISVDREYTIKQENRDLAKNDAKETKLSTQRVKAGKGVKAEAEDPTAAWATWIETDRRHWFNLISILGSNRGLAIDMILAPVERFCTSERKIADFISALFDNDRFRRAIEEHIEDNPGVFRLETKKEKVEKPKAEKDQSLKDI